MQTRLRITGLVVPIAVVVAAALSADERLSSALDRAGDNRAELEKAIAGVPERMRDGMRFLIENMPDRDLADLSGDFLIENTRLAYEVYEKAPWRATIPKALFLNDVLPYASVTERRDPWRREFVERFLPLVKGCSTPSEAAQRLNEKVFGILSVKYSTRRRRADQSPSESEEIGMASCTGLSIILVDACRAVGVPARVAGIPNWVNKRGNHTWVEIWDRSWHFTGAAEPSSRGLDHTWFQRDAALAIEDDPRHSIFAASFARTDIEFPMVWSRGRRVSAVNVTGRYAEPKKSSETAHLLVDVFDRVGGERVSVEVEVVSVSVDGGVCRFAGRSKDGRSDTNDVLAFDLPDKVVELRVKGKSLRQRVRLRKGSEQRVELFLDGRKPKRSRRF